MIKQVIQDFDPWLDTNQPVDTFRFTTALKHILY